MINLSKAAAREIKRLQSSRSQPNSRFRLGVKTGGCSGLFYTLELENNSNLSDRDRRDEIEGIDVVVDEQSYPYVRGLKIDYSEDLMGGGFRFENPNSSSHCSCGLSFSVQSSFSAP